MGYFPFFADISGAKCLVVGGGKVALRKIEKLIPFGVDIRVVSPMVCKEISAIDKLEIILRKFAAEDLENADIVISATGDERVGAEIFRLCSEKKIPVNTVDDIDKCTFLFPALACREAVTVGITTGGKSPLFARYLREQTEALLTEKNLAALDRLSAYRQTIKEKLTNEASRKALQEKILAALLSDEAVSDKEIDLMIKEFTENEAKDRNEKKQACYGADPNGRERPEK